MYGLYDKDGILRFINSDREACIAYAELFELSSSSFSLMELADNRIKNNNINLHLNHPEENNS